MTHHTDTERANFEAWLAPEYSREKWHTGEYTDDTVFSMFAAWQAARCAPAAPVPQVTDEMIEAANEAYCPFGDMELALCAALQVAPQSPEAAKHCDTPNYCQSVQRCTAMDEKRAKAAPVQMPEPDAWRYTDARGHYRYRGARPGFAVEYPLLKPEPLYTEQQVRQLLAAQERMDEGFELWWADHMPNATQTEAWAAWVALDQPAHNITS